MSSNICQEFTCAWGATSIRFIYLSYLLFLLTKGTSSICHMQACIWRTMLFNAVQCIKDALCYLMLQNKDFDMSVFRLFIISFHPFVSVKEYCISVRWISRISSLSLFFFFLVYLFTGAMHINKYGCKCARISQKGLFFICRPLAEWSRSCFTPKSYEKKK